MSRFRVRLEASRKFAPLYCPPPAKSITFESSSSLIRPTLAALVRMSPQGFVSGPESPEWAFHCRSSTQTYAQPVRLASVCMPLGGRDDMDRDRRSTRLTKALFSLVSRSPSGMPAVPMARSYVRSLSGRVAANHQVVLIMLSLAGIGWLLEARFALFEWYYQISRQYEALHAAGLVPCVLLVLLGAFLDTYRAHQEVLRERERIRAEMNMALRAAKEINEPLALIIANLEMVVPRMHPGNTFCSELQQVRDAAWTILDRVRELTEITTLPNRERDQLPSLISAVDGRRLSGIIGEAKFCEDSLRASNGRQGL
jgi:hypothetical protein